MNQQYQQTVQDQQEWEMWQVYAKACDDGLKVSFPQFCEAWRPFIETENTIARVKDDRR